MARLISCVTLAESLSTVAEQAARGKSDLVFPTRSCTRGDLLSSVFRKQISLKDSFPTLSIYEVKPSGRTVLHAKLYVCSEPPLGTTWTSLQRDLTETPVGEVCIYDPGLHLRKGARFAFQSKPGIVFPDDVKVLLQRQKRPLLTAKASVPTITLRHSEECLPWIFLCPGLSSLASTTKQHWSFIGLLDAETNATSEPLTRRLPESDPEKVDVDLSRGVFDALQSRNCDQPIT